MTSTLGIDPGTHALIRTIWEAHGTDHVEPDPAAPEAIDPQASATEPVSSRVAEVFARATWARLIEPGDAIAGHLIATLGAVAALETVIAGTLDTGSRAPASLDIDPAAFVKGIARWRPRLDKNATLHDLASAAETHTRLLIPGDPHWPDSLNDLGYHAPVVLWARGRTELLSEISLAVVGARANTGYGAHITAEITDGVCAAGATIVSGAVYILYPKLCCCFQRKEKFGVAQCFLNFCF
ncbi:hypothetical protein JOF28_000718 [Leucobacter exalbidus]|uniref:Smf/DprA SLOG domain-containing protein n=1 Tax=Leucobacter exalbidus TaxID=662960 RepID=A0A940T500_9MICO|nr:DNA-processing protein DprA [Leucobacter exalbidus]MBP1325486.1 hypothetical protein [Leucobacter exalbidus]